MGSIGSQIRRHRAGGISGCGARGSNRGSVRCGDEMSGGGVEWRSLKDRLAFINFLLAIIPALDLTVWLG